MNKPELTNAEKIQIGILQQLALMNQAILLIATTQAQGNKTIDYDSSLLINGMQKISKDSNANYQAVIEKLK